MNDPHTPRYRHAMRPALLAITICALTACSSTDDPEPDQPAPSAAWLDQWDDGRLDRIEEHDGQPVGISESEEMIYTQDCDLAEQLTSEGGPYGPDGAPGYAYICE